MPLHRIAVVAFDGISAFHLSVPCLVFSPVRAGAPDFALSVCAWEQGLLTTDAGFCIAVQDDLAALAAADTIIIPSWHHPYQAPPAALVDALQAAHRRGACIVGLCLGAYVLAAAGLLDGRPATTHWASVADFAQRFPNVRLHADVLYVDDGDVLTSAGTVAGIDCCLHLLRREYGAATANRVARRLVTPPHRQGGQAQYIEQPLPDNARDSRLSDVLASVRSRLGEAHTLDSLAERALMSRRTFTRHFRQLTGSTVGDWLRAERLSLSQRLLESSDLPIDRIAELAGFGSAASLRHHFGRAFGVAPSAWRETFKGPDTDPDAAPGAAI